MKYVNILLIALLASLSLTACDVEEGPIEEAGEAVDETIEDTQDAVEEGPIEEAGEVVNETIEDTQDAAEDVIDEIEDNY